MRRPARKRWGGVLQVLVAAALWQALPVGAEERADKRGGERDAMLQAIREDARETAPWTGRKAIGPEVMAAMARVPRASFVPSESSHLAYYNFPLGIGHGQTISQPFIVALMTDLLDTAPDHRVLEIGTGSGYQAAILAELVAEVYTIEIIPELAESAAQRLRDLGYDGVRVRTGDGWYGWPGKAPFDGILVTAVSERPPPDLVDQLAPGGRMVLPLGPADGAQMLSVIDKDSSGAVSRRDVLPVAFVPLTGDH
jgi:protein-L-isoaspartate(D-aspartate) O-methyltransferase